MKSVILNLALARRWISGPRVTIQDVQKAIDRLTAARQLICASSIVTIIVRDTGGVYLAVCWQYSVRASSTSCALFAADACARKIFGEGNYRIEEAAHHHFNAYLSSKISDRVSEKTEPQSGSSVSPCSAGITPTTEHTFTFWTIRDGIPSVGHCKCGRDWSVSLKYDLLPNKEVA